MITGPHEAYAPRAVHPQESWSIPPLQLKVYGLAAAGRDITEDMVWQGQDFVQREVVQSVADTGDSNELGFVIIHPGSLGLSISVHWWTQGSVLCQRFYRKLYGAEAPLNMAARPSIGCVWELGIVQAEQAIWIRTMMGKTPDADAYLTEAADLKSV